MNHLSSPGLPDGRTEVASEVQSVLGLAQGLATGLALIDPADWTVKAENAAFTRWFPVDLARPGAITERLRGVDLDRVRERLASAPSFAFETEVRRGARSAFLSILVRNVEFGGQTLMLAECQDVTKLRQSEQMMDSYSRMMEKNARELQKQKERVEKLLLNIMPRSVYEELKDFGTTTPRRFDSASVLMLDFVGFSEMAVQADPGTVVAELNDIFTSFDRIVETFGCERIKTIGDAYVAVAGLPEPEGEDTVNLARAALRMRRYLERRNSAHQTAWVARIGIATGTVIGSLVGIQKYVYDIFGPAVNLAARLEHHSQPAEITICADTNDLVRDEFVTRDIGVHDIKGFGRRQIHTLVGELQRTW
ncbi:MAG: adenylate/guanylate cyclase domain-containing protein [Alphaproteobacteria bacterium]|nr:adenylate/guanylate cyclase domain-containing protein [Alphaproteobacteria bacterium]